MTAHCCTAGDGSNENPRDKHYRRLLWAVLGINAAMFLVEMAAGVAARSVSLQADALDFLGDAANYGISLFVVGKALTQRATATLIKGAAMGLFGVWVIGAALWHAVHETLPHAQTMGVVGFAAFVANIAVFWMLWTYRSGDSNMRSVWLCSRNDVVGNFAVILAALGVFGTGRSWPDLVVAAVMASLALQGAWHVISLATRELRSQRGPEFHAAR